MGNAPRIVAGFPNEPALRRALEALRAEGLRVETYTPAELREPEVQLYISPLPLIMLAAAVLGGFGFFALQSYAAVSAYPINVGGRPNFSWPAFIVNAFEFGVLCAILAGFAGYVVVNRMPALYEPEDECDGLREASRDGWFLSVRGGDPAHVRSLLERADVIALQELPE